MQVELTRSLFNRFRDLILQRNGLYFDEARISALEPALRERARVCSCQNLIEYYDFLAANRGEEFRRLQDLITIPETSFFRTPAHFEALREKLLPELIRGQLKGRLRLWSAGCSIGAEAYSLAITARELMRGLLGWEVEVLATDISERSLAGGQRAVYNARAVQNVPPVLLEKYFQAQDGEYAVVDEIRRLVRFTYLNLLQEPFPWSLVGQMDVVLCENVLIYFQPPDTARAVQHIHSVLRPGGYLFLGYSETLWGIPNDFHLVDLRGCFAYQRPAPASHSLVGRPRGGRPAVGTPERSLPASPLRMETRRGKIHSSPQTGPRSALEGGKGSVGHSVPGARGPDRTGAEKLEDTYQQAQALATAGRTEAALDALGAALAISPQHVPCHLLSAQIHAGRDDLDRALVHANQAVQADSLRGDAHFLRGIICCRLGMPAEAAASYERALYVDPESPLIHFHLADLLRQQGKPADARRHYHNAIRFLERMPADQAVGEFSVGFLVQSCRRAVAGLGS